MNTERDELDVKAARLRDRLRTHTGMPAHISEAPARVQEAWARVQELADAATDALDAWANAAGEARRLDAARRAEYRAYLAGDGPKPKGAYKPADLAARRADILLECEARVELVAEARSAYDRLLQNREVLEETRAALVARFDGLQERAMAEATAAENTFRTWARTRAALAKVTADLGLAGGPDGLTPRLDKNDRRWLEEANDAWPAITRVLGSNDPLLSGRWAAMSREELTASPPVWAREILARNHPGSDDRRRLRRIELRERAEGRVVSALEVPADMSPEEAKAQLPEPFTPRVYGA